MTAFAQRTISKGEIFHWKICDITKIHDTNEPFLFLSFSKVVNIGLSSNMLEQWPQLQVKQGRLFLHF